MATNEQGELCVAAVSAVEAELTPRRATLGAIRRARSAGSVALQDTYGGRHRNDVGCWLNDRFLSIASTTGVALSEADIRKMIEIVRHLSDDVKARAERW